MSFQHDRLCLRSKLPISTFPKDFESFEKMKNSEIEVGKIVYFLTDAGITIRYSDRFAWKPCIVLAIKERQNRFGNKRITVVVKALRMGRYQILRKDIADLKVYPTGTKLKF